MATITEIIQKAMAEATYCATCEEDFTPDNDKVAPDRQEVFWTGNADVTCERCVERSIDSWLDMINS